MQPSYSRENQDPEGAIVTTEITGLFLAFHSPKPHEMEVAMRIGTAQNPWELPSPTGLPGPQNYRQMALGKQGRPQGEIYIAFEAGNPLIQAPALPLGHKI